MKKIGIVANLQKTGVLELREKLDGWLKERKLQVMNSEAQSIDRLVKDCDLIICLGGDGTMLRVASYMKEKSVPVLGVNCGRIGFLTEVKAKEVTEELESVLAGKFRIQERLMLACIVRSDQSKKEKRFVALNDMVISREGLTRLLRVEARVSGEVLTSFAGDGLIIATPTGSTAYSLSAGGAIVHPKLEALIITPICPHASSLRPLVVRGDEKISVKIGTNRKGEKALLTVDGQENFEIDDSYTVSLTRSDIVMKLIQSSKRSYFTTLRENFKFPA